MLAGEADGVAAGFFVDEVVHAALAIEGDRAAAVFRDGGEAHGLEQGMEFVRVGVRVFDEAEPVGAGGVVGGDPSGRGVVREGAHAVILQSLFCEDYAVTGAICV